MINGYNICLEMIEQVIFADISFVFDHDQRIGLVGRNGSGKSTLLKVIAGQQQLDSGAVSIQKGKSIAYLSQDVVLQSDKSIVEETYTAFAYVADLLDEQKKIEAQLDHADDLDELLERYAVVCEKLLHVDQEGMRAEAKKVLMGLGFKPEVFDEPVSTLSVGWKMRIVLAKLLLQKADFYLFDEPTNHLDIVAKEWFLQFLKRAPFGFVLVCHDRYFLNQLCDVIFELERGNGKLYVGDYNDYEQQKAHDEALLEMQYKNQQRDIKQKQEFIDRFKAKASKATVAQSMVKKLEKIERIELPPKAPDINFNFPPIQQSGSTVLKIENVAHSFGEKQIFKNVSFEVQRGKKIALVAANGVGKTTLFNLIAHKLPLETGTITLGYNVHYTVFDQDQTASLAINKTILENITESCPKATEQKVRAFAGSFLFTKDSINKKVGVLSGGEKNRVGMIKVLLQNANLLLLDEPTNHLDIQSKDILLTALNAYQGTILFVSHDQDFVNKLATDVVELSVDGAKEYQGNYELYLYQKQQEAQKAQGAEQVSNKKVSQDKKEAEVISVKKPQSEVKVLERTIQKLEHEITKTENSFADLVFGTPKFADAQKKLTDLKKELAVALAEWENSQS
ncbi:MAG TPA: ABC-F family ATP-binding cassette domain-containing protein [Candidatus Babeliales bacterium]|nr:ABC-F family ATP-binding cassette domain-containing protein [Candidatus Babeliales bacterium]